MTHRLGVVAVLAAMIVAGPGPAYPVTLTPQQISPSGDGISASWMRAVSSTSRGQILFFGSNDNVYLYNGTTIQIVQLTDGSALSTVSGLGPASTAGQVIGGWRRGAGFGYVSTNGGTPAQVTLNPEGVAISEGCVFMVLQDPPNGSHVFKINPATGSRTKLSSGTVTLGAIRVASSGCDKAAWTWAPTGTDPVDIQYWNGTTTTTIVPGDASIPSFAGGKIVYSKTVGGIQQVFLIDTNVSLTPVQLSAETDPTKTLDRPQTDGRHVAWYRYNTNGTSPSTAQIILNGGLVFPTGPLAKIDNIELPFQLNRGQLLWKNSTGPLSYDDGRQTFGIDPSPATTITNPWLSDGYVAFTGLTAGADEVFRITGTAPDDASQPSPPMLVVATPGTAQVKWDSVLGATSYNAYVAYAPGVTKDNYLSLAGGRRLTGVTSGFTIPDVPLNTTYYVAITALDGPAEGPSSRVASTTVVGNLTWQSVGGLSSTSFYSVAADATNGSLGYAGANGSIYRSIDGAINWTQVLTSATTGSSRVAALAVTGQRVLANMMSQADIWQSLNGGTNWGRILEAGGFGELNGSLAVDPADTSVLYAGDFILPGKSSAHSLVIKSANGGANWTHTAEGAGIGDEIHAYALATAPTNPTTLYAGGSGTPNVVRSTNGGTSWTSAGIPSGGGVYSLAIDPGNASIVYATTYHKGVFKSLDGGSSWTAKNSGLAGVSPDFSGGAGFNSILVDPQNSSFLHLGAGNGYWYSLDAGESWNAANNGFGGSPAWINALAMTSGRRLIAATGTGLYMLSLAPAPVVSSVSPNSGSMGGGTSITITGSAFQAGATVTFGGTPATNVAVVSATTITATTPSHTAGSVAVVVTNSDGQAGTLSGGFTYTSTPDTPTGVVAMAQTTTSIVVTWNAAAGASSYQVWRKSPGVAFTQIATPTLATFTDNSVSANTSYQYRVRAVGSGVSGDSASDIATTVLFSNDPLVAGTVVQAVHLAQLRSAIVAVRELAGGLPTMTFTDAASPGVIVKSVHITEMRSGLDAALPALGLPASGYTDPSLTGVAIKALHFQEIRHRIK